jgi:hypothetical protein
MTHSSSTQMFDLMLSMIASSYSAIMLACVNVYSNGRLSLW